MQRGYEYAQAQYDNAEPGESTYINCAECDGEIYDDCYEWEEKIICPDCLKEHFGELTTREKADLLGATAYTAETWIEEIKRRVRG